MWCRVLPQPAVRASHAASWASTVVTAASILRSCFGLPSAYRSPDLANLRALRMWVMVMGQPSWVMAWWSMSDTAGSAHRPRDEFLRPIQRVPRLDLRLPRHFVAESWIAVGSDDPVAVVKLVDGGIDFAARDAAAPAFRVPDGGSLVVAVSWRENETVTDFGFDAGPVIVFGTIEPQTDFGASGRVREP